MNCQQCDQEHELEQSHSSVIVLQKVSGNDYMYYQCDQGQFAHGHTWQHWNCSHDCMKSSLTECVNEHYSEEKLHPIQSGSTTLHHLVLRSGCVCSICQSPLSITAYRFCVTRATPLNAVEDGSHDALTGWCCSLDHAKMNVLSYIGSIEEVIE